MGDETRNLEAELAKLEQAINAQEDLRGILSDEQIDAIIADLANQQKATRALMAGSGAVAQDEGVAAGERGIAIAGDMNAPAATGDHGRAVQADIYIEQRVQGKSKAENQAAITQRYLKRVVENCNVLPIAALGGEEGIGEDVTLEQVYIALNTTSKVRMEVAESAGSRIEPGTVTGIASTEERTLSALDVATNNKRLVLLGDPGGGKSTFVRQLAAQLAEAFLCKQPFQDGWEEGIVPVLVVLRDLAVRLNQLELDGISSKERDQRLMAAVWEQWQHDLQHEYRVEVFAGILETLLEDGKVLLIFDGLDEVAVSARGQVKQALQAIQRHYRTLDHVIVTCRVRSYTGDTQLAGFDAHTLATFDEDQIKQFISGWYNALSALGRVRADQLDERIDDLQNAALSEALQGMATNPLLLTTMAIIHQREIGLPNERVRLYALAVQVLLNRWQRHKGFVTAPDLERVLADDRTLRGILEAMAYELHRLQSRQILRATAGDKQGLVAEQAEQARLSRGDLLVLLERAEYLGDATLAAQFLMYVDQRAGILVGHGGAETAQLPQTYDFADRTFQEYLAGCRMVAGRGVAREYWQRASEGDFWYVAAMLGAEELLHNRRSPQLLLDLAYRLYPSDGREDETAWRALLWSGQIAAMIGTVDIRRDGAQPGGDAGYLDRLLPGLVRLLEESHLTPIERKDAGMALASLGDPRGGVGIQLDRGLPDIHWCLVPAGPFRMGGGKYEDERPVHDQDIGYDYWISRYPITNAQFEAFDRAGGYQNRTFWTEAGWRWRDSEGIEEPLRVPLYPGTSLTIPRVAVSWYEALAYTNWLTKQLRDHDFISQGWTVRLPSEPEWEKAARGGLQFLAKPVILATDAVQTATHSGLVANDLPERAYPWGEDFDPQHANADETAIGTITAVGCFPLGASPYGCQDMSGNVWEWTKSLWGEDIFEPEFKYPYQCDDGRERLNVPADVARVLRGGAFLSDQNGVRCAYRYFSVPFDRSLNVGFRVVASPAEGVKPT